MGEHTIIYGSTAEELLAEDCSQEYQSILSDASIALSEAEFKHLVDIADVGFVHAMQKDEYLEHLGDTISEWVAEEQRSKFYCTHETLEIDFGNWYNAPKEVGEHMRPKRKYRVIPSFYVYFGMVTLALFCIFTTIFVLGILQNVFFINPVYLFMLSVGFLGLLATDITAIIEWRKGQNV